ncbi:laccase domain-containing protein [Sneathia sp. DSM 16630]|nr:laccase domain-containing protein [Sneathia sp. DSM 16630]
MNKQIALNCGIDAKHIFTNNYCTYVGNFFSYRRDKTAKRMAAIISKKGSK